MSGKMPGDMLVQLNKSEALPWKQHKLYLPSCCGIETENDIQDMLGTFRTVLQCFH